MTRCIICRGWTDDCTCDTAADEEQAPREGIEGLVWEWRAQDMRDVKAELAALAALGGLLE